MKMGTELPLPGVELGAGKMPGHWFARTAGQTCAAARWTGADPIHAAVHAHPKEEPHTRSTARRLNRRARWR